MGSMGGSVEFDEHCLLWAQEGICYSGNPGWLMTMKKMILWLLPAPNIPQSMETSYLKNDGVCHL